MPPTNKQCTLTPRCEWDGEREIPDTSATYSGNCGPSDGKPLGTVHTLVPKRVWVSESCSLSLCVWLFATPWTAPNQAPLSLGFPRQEYWSGLSFPSPGDLPKPGVEPSSPVSSSFNFCFLLVFILLGSLGSVRVCNSIYHTSSF